MTHEIESNEGSGLEEERSRESCEHAEQQQHKSDVDGFVNEEVEQNSETTIVEVTVNEQQFLQELKLRQRVITASNRLQSLFAKDTHTNVRCLDPMIH